MRIVAALAAFLLLATPAPVALYAPARLVGKAVVHALAVPLDATKPGRRTLGGLVYLGGWALTSNHPRFGGISALHVTDGEAVALEDRGFVATFPLPSAPQATLPLRIDRLAEGPDLPGLALGRDSESLVVAGSRAWVGFERSNAIWRYALPAWNGGGGLRPSAMRGWRDNGGSEAMLRLADGRFLVFAETTPAAGEGTDLLLFGSDPAASASTPVHLTYQAPEGFALTDAAQLLDGRLLFLNRRLSLLWFTASLTIGEAPALEEGAILTGREIARFEPPVIAENMEALSVTRENGRDTIWVASDDNYSRLQRTLLLKFQLAP